MRSQEQDLRKMRWPRRPAPRQAALKLMAVGWWVSADTVERELARWRKHPPKSRYKAVRLSAREEEEGIMGMVSAGFLN